MKVVKNLIFGFSFENPDAFLESLATDWQQIVTENWKLCFAVVFGLFMALAIPIAGIIW